MMRYEPLCLVENGFEAISVLRLAGMLFVFLAETLRMLDLLDDVSCGVFDAFFFAPKLALTAGCVLRACACNVNLTKISVADRAIEVRSSHVRRD